jgi:5-methylcytosine-specific restriction endonuclease McrA
MTDVLVLSAGYIAHDVISDRDAICHLYKNTAYTVVESDRVMRSPSVEFKVPHVIALLTHKKVRKQKVGFSKLNVIYRDDCTCQYCGKQFSMNDLTVDHIIPKSRWMEIKRTSKRNWNNWQNCVASCKWCNNAKGNNLLEELKWKLIRKPFEPEYLPKIIVSKKKAEEKQWIPFCGYNVRLVQTT